jgi:hypothetical protein
MSKGLTVEKAVLDKNGSQLEVIVSSSDKNVRGKTNRHIAEWMDGSGKPVVFLAMRKGFSVFMDEYNILQFRMYTFTTNVPKAIEYLRSHPLFNIEFFEGDYPEVARKKLEEYRSKFTKDPEEHEPSYGKALW